MEKSLRLHPRFALLQESYLQKDKKERDERRGTGRGGGRRREEIFDSVGFGGGELSIVHQSKHKFRHRKSSRSHSYPKNKHVI